MASQQPVSDRGDFRLYPATASKVSEMDKGRSLSSVNAKDIAAATAKMATEKKSFREDPPATTGKFVAHKANLDAMQIPGLPAIPRKSYVAGDARLKRDARQTIKVISPESGFTTTPVEEEHSLASTNGVHHNVTEYGLNGVPSIKLDTHLSTTPLQLPASLKLSTLVRPSQVEIVRDILGVVYGHNGVYFRLNNVGCEVVPNTDTAHFGIPACQIGYAGFLCRELQIFAKVRDNDATGGVSLQNLGALVSRELLDYKARLATLIDQQRRDGSSEIQRLTVLRLNSIMRPEVRKLNVLLNIVKAAEKFRGGQLVNMLKKQHQQGDCEVKEIVSKLLRVAVEPLLKQLRRWVFFGYLEDPHEEFFVKDLPDTPAEAYWGRRYDVRAEMVPFFLTEDETRELFMGGKSVAFVRHVCSARTDVPDMDNYSGIKQWELSGPDPIWDSALLALTPGAMAEFVSASRTASENVITLLRNNHMLGEHFDGFRKFLFMELGDFALHLMERLSDELDKPGEDLMLRNLSSILKDTVKSTTAQFESPDVIACLDTGVLAIPAGSKDLGWDAFVLGYYTKGPLTTVFPDKILQRYRRIFVFLWRMKRAEFVLNRVWKADVFSRLTTCTQPDYLQFLHKARILSNNMRQFILQFDECFNADVLVKLWQTFSRQVTGAKSLDQLLLSHQEYLAKVEEKCFISSDSVSNIREFQRHLRVTVDSIIKFGALFEQLIRSSTVQTRGYDEPAFYETLGRYSSELDSCQMTFQNEAHRFAALLAADKGDVFDDLQNAMEYLTHQGSRGKSTRKDGSTLKSEPLNLAGLA